MRRKVPIWRSKLVKTWRSVARRSKLFGGGGGVIKILEGVFHIRLIEEWRREELVR